MRQDQLNGRKKISPMLLEYKSSFQEFSMYKDIHCFREVFANTKNALLYSQKNS